MINLKYKLDQKGGSDLADLIKLCNGVERINIIPSINPNKFNQKKANDRLIDTKNIKFENALFFLFPRCYDKLLRFFYKCVKITDDGYPHWLGEVVNENCGKMVVQLNLFEELDKIVTVKIEDSCSGTNCHEKVKEILYAQAIIKGGTYTKPIVKYLFNELLIRLLLFLKTFIENDGIKMDYNVNNKGKEISKILSKDIRLPNSKYFTDVPTSLEDYNSSQAVVIFLTDLTDKFFELSSERHGKRIKQLKKRNLQLFNEVEAIRKKNYNDWSSQDENKMDKYFQLLDQIKQNDIRLGFSYINSAILGYKEMVYFGY